MRLRSSNTKNRQKPNYVILCVGHMSRCKSVVVIHCMVYSRISFELFDNNRTEKWLASQCSKQTVFFVSTNIILHFNP